MIEIIIPLSLLTTTITAMLLWTDCFKWFIRCGCCRSEQDYILETNPL